MTPTEFTLSHETDQYVCYIAKRHGRKFKLYLPHRVAWSKPDKINIYSYAQGDGETLDLPDCLKPIEAPVREVHVHHHCCCAEQPAPKRRPRLHFRAKRSTKRSSK